MIENIKANVIRLNRDPHKEKLDHSSKTPKKVGKWLAFSDELLLLSPHNFEKM
jgi:hypothetical protein